MQFFLFPVHPPDATENSIIHYFFPDDIIIADLRQESGYNFFFSAGFCISIKNFHFFADIRTGIQSLYDDPLADFISIQEQIAEDDRKEVVRIMVLRGMYKEAYEWVRCTGPYRIDR